MNPENAVAGGNKMIGPMFMKLGTQTEGTGTYSIQDLIPTGAVVPDGEHTDNTAISLMKLNASGGADGYIYYWRDGTFTIGGRKRTVKGWYQDGQYQQDDVQLTAGQAIWVYFPSGAQCTLSVSGEVPSGEVYMNLRTGNSAVCNPIPKQLSLQQVLPFAAPGVTVPDGEHTDNTAISLMKLNPNGGADGYIYYWRDGTFTIGGRKRTVHGWYKDGQYQQDQVPLAPGEGIWVYCPIEGIALDFPSAFAPAE